MDKEAKTERGMFITMKELKMHDTWVQEMMRMGQEQFD